MECALTTFKGTNVFRLSTLSLIFWKSKTVGLLSYFRWLLDCSGSGWEAVKTRNWLHRTPALYARVNCLNCMRCNFVCARENIWQSFQSGDVSKGCVPAVVQQAGSCGQWRSWHLPSCPWQSVTRAATDCSHQLLACGDHWQWCLPAPLWLSLLPLQPAEISLCCRVVLLWWPSTQRINSNWASSATPIGSWVIQAVLVPHPPKYCMVKLQCGIFPAFRVWVGILLGVLALHVLNWSHLVCLKNLISSYRPQRAKTGTDFVVKFIMRYCV